MSKSKKIYKYNTKEEISFTIPIEVSKGIINADADIVDKENTDSKTDNMYVEGLASSPKIDLDKQIIKPSGFILDYFLKNGFINWNHQGAISPDAIIGEPVKAEVKGEKFYIKVRLYPWSNLAKSIYKIARELDSDENTDRTLGFSIEGLPLEQTEDEKITKMLITGCAICFVPKNDDTYAKICKGATIQELKEIRKSYKFEPIYKEGKGNNQKQYIANIEVGENQILVDDNMNFHIRKNPILNSINIEDVQKGIILIAEGYKEGYISKEKKDKFIKDLQSRLKCK